MVLDYSKWDKLELSDDSDIEVHPNVDKKSFIKWKQRDIHEKREQAKFRMLQLEVNIETNEDLEKRIRKLISAAESGRKVALDIQDDVKFSEEGEEKQKPSKATSPEQPRYSDMIESMLLQIVSAGKPSQEEVIAKMKENLGMIESALKDEKAELEKLQKEKSQHITTEDIRTGWDSTIVYKPTEKAAQPEPSSATASSNSAPAASSSKTTTIETINTPSAPPKPRINEDGLEEMFPQTVEFGDIPKESWEKCFTFLMKYPFIVTEGQKDALTMSAFEHELAGESEHMETVVWNSSIIQLCLELGKQGTQVLFKNITNPNNPARKMFEQTVQATVTHIRGRCKLLAEEHMNETENLEEETIQLRAVDPDTELVVGIPPEGSEGRAIYDKFSPEVKSAIEEKSLEKLNEILGNMSLEKAETFVEQLGESGVLLVENKIYDADEFEAEKQRVVNATNDEVD